MIRELSSKVYNALSTTLELLHSFISRIHFQLLMCIISNVLCIRQLCWNCGSITLKVFAASTAAFVVIPMTLERSGYRKEGEHILALLIFLLFNEILFFLLIVPPERISIRDESNSERNSVVGPYSEGDTMKLKCDVFGGRPTPNVTWFRDGNPMSSETFLVPSGRNLRSEIIVERLSRQDLNSRFTCKAINHLRATPVEASVQLDMNCKLEKKPTDFYPRDRITADEWLSFLSSSISTVAPLNIRLLGAHQHQPLSAGRRYDLLCQSAGSRPPAVITWFRDSERLDRTTETVCIAFKYDDW